MTCFIGIDFGDQRTGLAYSDEGGHFAFPHSVVSSQWETVREEIKMLITKRGSEGVVVGLPQNFSGEDTEQTKKVRFFGERLTKELGISVVFQNVILTSKQIDKSGGSTRAMQDASAAALMLQPFLDTRRSTQ